jgi:hypothetical protein
MRVLALQAAQGQRMVMGEAIPKACRIRESGSAGANMKTCKVALFCLAFFVMAPVALCALVLAYLKPWVLM